MSVDHYENFPVASILLPAKLQPAVKNLYAFARTADDIADEGNAKTEIRQARLTNWQTAIKCLYAKQALPADLSASDQQIFSRLNTTIEQYSLPSQPFLDLLLAFEQDLYQQSYNSRAELLEYCSRSANPVGLLMLHLFNAINDLNVQQSNAICTGLQLANFWQDIAIDFDKQRCYIPHTEFAKHGADPKELAQLCQARPEEISLKWQALIKDQVHWAGSLLIEGSPLAWRLPGRIGWELRLVVNGGLRILEKLAMDGYNPFAKRPMLDLYDRYLLCWRALRKPSLHHFENRL